MKARSISGLAVAQLVDAFRLGPDLEKKSLGRQLRAWIDGEPKAEATRRRIVRACCRIVFKDVGGPVSTADLVAVATEVVLQWCAWIDGFGAAERDIELNVDWFVEHTLQLFGTLLGVARFAWGQPLSAAPKIESWFPSSSDEKPLTADLLDEVFVGLEERALREGHTLAAILAAARTADDGKERKLGTVKSWRTGKTVPNSEPVEELARAANDTLLRFKLGVRGVLERLATVSASSAPAPVEQRNTTLMWTLCAEMHAHAVQQSLTTSQCSPRDAVLALGQERIVAHQLPMTPDREKLPFHLKQRRAVIIDVALGGNRGRVVVML